MAKTDLIMNDATNDDVMTRFRNLYEELFLHDGYGRIELEMKILRRGQKEIILRCGKEYRFVIDFPTKRKLKMDDQVLMESRFQS